MSRQWDALVIGAGPAGLRAASVIAESGLEVVLVDEQAFPLSLIHIWIGRTVGTSLWN